MARHPSLPGYGPHPRWTPLNQDESEILEDIERLLANPSPFDEPMMDFSTFWNNLMADAPQMTEEARPLRASRVWVHGENFQPQIEVGPIVENNVEVQHGRTEVEQLAESDHLPQHVGPQEVLLVSPQSALTSNIDPYEVLRISSHSFPAAKAHADLEEMEVVEETHGIQDNGPEDEQLTQPAAASPTNSTHIQSDADITHRPPADYKAEPADKARCARYVNKLRRLWLEDSGDPNQDIAIPNGYLYVMVPRGYSTRKDLYLYGHPRRYKFKSVNEFYPHFRHLIHLSRGSTNAQCRCKGCTV